MENAGDPREKVSGEGGTQTQVPGPGRLRKFLNSVSSLSKKLSLPNKISPVSIVFAAAALILAILILWLIDKFFLLYTTKSYVDELADAFDLNRHLTKALVILTFLIAIFFVRHITSLSKRRRLIGVAGVSVLLIGHSLALWYSTRGNYFDRSGAATKCYVLTRDGNITYGERAGIDPATGRVCRPVTAEMLERLQKYEQGKRPNLVTQLDPVFFDPRTGEPIIWYYQAHPKGDVQLFDLMGFHPETGEELIPITKVVVETWKVQTAEAKKRIPKAIDPTNFVFFDPRNGSPRAWYWRAPEGKYEFFDSAGFHPRVGEPLKVVTREDLENWKSVSAQKSEPKRIDPNKYAFFDPATGAARAWYWRDAEGKYEFFDNAGFHPRVGEPLKVVTREELDAWKNASTQKTEPKRIDPSQYAFFDPATGAARVWFWRNEDGNYEFYDSPGFHPRTGDKLGLVTREITSKWKLESEHPKKIESPLNVHSVNPVPNLEARAKIFLYEYMENAGAENAQVLSYVMHTFAPTIDYFGKRMSRNEVVQDKRAFMNRWPERVYRIKSETIQINCNATDSYCDVGSEFSFRAASPVTGKVSSGVAINKIRLAFPAGELQVQSENGSVVSRSVEDTRVESMAVPSAQQPNMYSGPGANQPQMSPQQNQQIINGVFGIMRQMVR